MPKPGKKRTAKRPTEQATGAEVTARDRKWRRPEFIIASAVVILILIIIGISYYFSEDQRHFRLNVITVDDITIRMDYFLERCQASGSDPLSMLGRLAREEVIKLEAPLYGIEVTPEDIDRELRITAEGASGNLTESEFKEWYRQRLNETGLSDSEYRDSTATSLLASYLYEYVAARTPTVDEQVHLHVMLLETQKEAEKAKARLEAGEDFADLARELSLDTQSGENGGDLGWIPHSVIDYQIEDVAFNLSPGVISEPMIYYDTSDPSTIEVVGYHLFMVSERADAREVDEEYIEALIDKAFNDWLSEKVSQHEIVYHGINNGFDSETNAWINWQLSKK